jgi:hypothetical protein
MPKKGPKTRALASGVSYKGPLAEPIHKSIWAVWLGAKSEDILREERILKLPLLLKLYGIDERSPNAWADLAWALACDHVPGMQSINKVSRKRGRKPSWKSGLGQELLGEVDALRAKKKIGIGKALEELRADKTKAWKKYPKNSLSTRYREAVQAEKAELKKLSSTLAFLTKVFGKLPAENLRRNSKI